MKREPPKHIFQDVFGSLPAVGHLIFLRKVNGKRKFSLGASRREVYTIFHKDERVLKRVIREGREKGN